MSIIHVTQIRNYITNLFKDIIDLTDVETAHLQQKENFLLTRSLTAYAVYYLASASVDAAAASITDGSEDNGIDALHYDERNKTLYIVQSKWIYDGNSEPSNGDVKKFLSGIKDLFNLRFEVFNSKVNSMKDKITDAVLDANTNFEVILVYTGLNFSDHSRRDIDDFLADVNDASEICSVTILNQSKLHESLRSGVTGDPINIQIGIKEWGKKSEPYEAFYGQVNGSEVAQWWTNHGKKLFAKNLRELIGETDINKDIRRTIEEEPEKFWYYNNGITIVCNSIRKSALGGGDNAFGNFVCEDISIVNGAQTVGTIGKFGSDAAALEHLQSLYVPVRVISLEQADEDFGKQITKNNNTQNRIENRDFVSLDPQQARIQTELAIEGIKYYIMRSETIIRAEKTFDLVESTTALACASSSVSIAVQLKREIGKLWENIEKTPYIQLFNPGISGLYVWNCVQVQRRVDRELQLITSNKEGRDYSVAVHGNRIISHLVFQDINPNSLKSPSFNFEDFLTRTDISVLVQDNYALLNQSINDFYSNAVIPTLFKNVSKCHDLVNKINEIKVGSPD